MSSLQPVTPAALDRIVKQCLAKEPDERWQTASDLCRELQWIKDGGGQVAIPAPLPVERAKPAWRKLLPWSVAVVLLISAALLAWTHFREAPPAPQPVTRLALALPAGQHLA